MSLLRRHLLLLLWIALTTACGKEPKVSPADTSALASHKPSEVEQSFARDIDDIQKRDTLVVLSPYNSTTYFLFRGEPMGYEYELLREFAKDLGVSLKVVVVNDRDSLFAMLNSGRGDIAAARLIPLESDSGRVRFTRELYRADPVLVQQKAPVSKAISNLPDPVDTILKRGPAEAAPREIVGAGACSVKARRAREQEGEHPATVTVQRDIDRAGRQHHRRHLCRRGQRVFGSSHQGGVEGERRVHRDRGESRRPANGLLQEHQGSPGARAVEEKSRGQ